MRPRKASFAANATSESQGGLAMQRERVPITYMRLSRMKLASEATTRAPQARTVVPHLRVPHLRVPQVLAKDAGSIDDVWRAGMDESPVCRRNAGLPPHPAVARAVAEASVITFGAPHNAASGMAPLTAASSPAVASPSRPTVPSHAVLPLTTSTPPPPQQQRQPCISRASTQLEIEGTRTGEELIVDANVHRRPTAVTMGGEEAQLAPLRRRAAQLQVENKALVDKLRRRRAEFQDAHALGALTMQENEARLDLMARSAEQREGVLLMLVREAVRCTSKLASSQAVAERQLQEIKLAMTQRAEELKRALAAAQAEAAASQTRAQTTQSAALSSSAAELANVRAQMETLRTQSAQDKERLERERSELQHTLLQRAREIEALQTRAARDEYLVAQSRLFVKNVCQPNFSVVKDDSLVPVDPDRTTPTGFVLVPLTVLLHGYAILPEEERYEVIAMYEAKAKQLL